MRTKKVNECAVTSERIGFLVKTRIVMSCPHCGIPLISVFCGSGVVSGIRGKQMTPLLLNEAFSANKITIIIII